MNSEHTALLHDDDDETHQVYPIIHMIRADVMHFIDTPLTFEALTAPDITYTLIRPLEEKYNNVQRKGNKSVVFCFLLNRAYFIRDQHLTTGPLSSTRALLCEILAIRTLRDHGNSLLDLALVLTTSWPVWSGADPQIVARAREETDDDLEERVGNAIEMAIISKAKRFIKSSPFQKVIDAIWIGKCVYQAESSHSILSDTYKRTPIHFYDPHKAPLLDHYRLKVPAIRSVMEYTNFLVLFILFIIAIETNEVSRLNIPEIVFMVYSLGFTLEKVAAMQEHGISVYFKGTWNGFDLAFVTAYCVYASFRLYGVFRHLEWAQNLGVDFLAVIACLMFPRLAFVTLKNNLMVLALRAMISQFVILMLIAAFCFTGFLYALWTLSRKGAGYSVGTIAWWMLDLWFGLDASGFDRAFEFDVVFGPVLMITYACLSNTLLLTVLVSILSNTFSRISEDAAAEAMFRRAVSTIEGVKADSLFSYQPPVNLIALLILLPSSYMLSPRWFHKVNVLLIRVTNFPILLLIAWYERQSKKTGSVGFYNTFVAAIERILDTLPRQLKRLTFFEGLAGSDADIDVIFEMCESDSALDTQDYNEIPIIDELHQQEASPQNDPSSRPSPTPTQASPTPKRLRQSRSHLEMAQQTLLTSSRQQTSPAHTVPRQRVNSQFSRGDISQSISPLAQVFQPLVLDDDVGGDGAPPPGPLISFGPASRRRLTSMQSTHRKATSDLSHALSMSSGRFPTAGATADQETTIGSGLLSSSPGQQETQIPETVEQVEEEGSAAGGMVEWTKRLERMEDRQKRIEVLLLELAHDTRRS